MEASHAPLGFILLLIPLLTPTTSAQEWVWAQQAGGAEWDTGRSVAVDVDGNAYLTGYFEERAAFGSFNLESASGRAVFVAKYDPDGVALWAQQAGGVFSDEGLGIAVDGSGNAYVTGYFIEGATFGAFTLAGAGHADVFVAKYSSDGEVLWARQAGGSRWDHGAAIAVDTDGYVYVTGTFTGTATFGAFTLESAGLGDMFVAKYSPAGVVLWVRKAGGPDPDGGTGIALAADGSVFVTGEFSGTVAFGEATLSSAGQSDLFVAKYSADGGVLWVRSAGGWSSDSGRGVAVDAAGDVYVTGDFTDEAAFGSHTLTGAGGSDIFLAKYSLDGEVLWARRAGGDLWDVGNAVAVDALGNVHLTGHFHGTATFEALTLNSDGAGDLFVVKYSPEGDVLWGQRAGGPADNSGMGIAVNAAGTAYVTGRFSGTASFGASVLTAVRVWDVFVARYSGIEVITEGGPVSPKATFLLSNVWPHPVSARATATLSAQAGLQHVRAEVFDALGRRVALAFEGVLAVGVPEAVEVDAWHLAPGVYVLRVAGGGAVAARRFVVVR